MKQKNILIIAYYFPPLGGVPVQRTLKFIRHLPEYEWNPVVLTVLDGYDHFHPNDPSLINKIPDGVEVIRTKEIGIASRVIRFFRSKAPGRFTDEVVRLRKLLYNSLLFPDEKNYWIPGAVLRGLQLLSKQNIGAIYASGYPWSAFLIGTILSKSKGIPLILDFRDAWTLNPRGLWNNRFQRFWESKVLLQASKAVFATNLMREDYVNRYPRIDRRKFITITNGYDSADFRRIEGEEKKNSKRFLITITGTFNDNVPPLDTDQSPYYFLKGLTRSLKNDNDNMLKNIFVRFVGDFGRNNKDFVKRLGLENVVEITGHVPHGKSIEFQLESDLLLLIISHCPESESILTGKLFEYIGARKPILALVPDGEAKDLIIKERLGITVGPNDIDGIKNAIFKFYKEWKQNSLKLEGNDCVFKKYEMKALTKKLVEAIEENSNGV
jgi:glycosyltransferase involved in cell wall biosynthesis